MNFEFASYSFNLPFKSSMEAMKTCKPRDLNL